MRLTWFLLIGLGAGALAGWLMGHRMRIVGDLVVGVVGSFVGSFLFGLLGLPSGGFGAFLSAVFGALTLLSVLKLLRLGGA